MPKRLMLDTNVYDLVVARRDLAERLNHAVEDGAIEVLRTRVQEEEIARIPDASRRAAMRRVRGRTVPVSDAPWQGMPRGGAPSEDALIVATAEESADVLVTEDRELAKQAKAGGRLEVWRFDQLVGFVENLL
jgi:predicted nucleic acid-binding protein